MSPAPPPLSRRTPPPSAHATWASPAPVQHRQIHRAAGLGHSPPAPPRPRPEPGSGRGTGSRKAPFEGSGGSPASTPPSSPSASGRTDSRARVQRVLRGAVSRCCSSRARLDDPAQIHHRHPVRDVPGEPEVMGDDERREAQLVPQAQQERQDLAPYRRVQRGHRLVGHDQLRLQHQRPGDHDPLALTARQLVREAQEEPLRRAQARPTGRPRRPPARHPRTRGCAGLGHRVVHRVPVERAARVLEDQLHAFAVRLQRPARVVERGAAEGDPPGGGRDQAEQGPEPASSCRSRTRRPARRSRRAGCPGRRRRRPGAVAAPRRPGTRPSVPRR